jgi:hypothetical protein
MAKQRQDVENHFFEQTQLVLDSLARRGLASLACASKD